MKNRDALVDQSDVRHPSIINEVVFFSFGLVATLLFVCYFFKLGDFHFRVPMVYQGDVNAYMSQVKNIRLEGSIFKSSNLGFPFGQDLHDTIAPGEILYQGFLWLVTRFEDSEALITNLIFLFSYVLIYATTFVSARIVKISPQISCFVGVLVTFLPYHFQRGTSHLYLANYFVAPLVIAICVRHLTDDPLLKDFPINLGLRAIGSWLKRWDTLACLFIASLAATTSMYYSVASLLFIGCSAVIGAIVFKNVGRLISACAVSVFILLLLAFQFLPNLLYQQKNGNNLAVVARSLEGVETYSLKITAMLSPIINHRIDALATFGFKSTQVPLHTEYTGSLGLVGSVSLVVLVGAAIIGILNKSASKYGPYSTLAVIAIFFGTTGGFAQFIAQFGFTQLRAWNRISVFIACVAFMAFGTFVDNIRKKVKRPSFVFALTGLVLLLSLFDMTPKAVTPDFQTTTNSWLNDQTLVQEIESSFGKKAAIFQLPVVPYPEYPPVVRLTDYDHLRGYLHSDTLKWSYGGVKGRKSDWQNALPTVPDAAMLSCINHLGFSVIWLDRYGYENPDEMVNQLVSLGAVLKMQDGQNRVQIFDLRQISASPNSCPNGL